MEAASGPTPSPVPPTLRLCVCVCASLVDSTMQKTHRGRGEAGR